MNPLLDPLSLPPFPAMTADAIRVALDAALAEHRGTIESLTSRRPSGFADAWMPYERANILLDALWSAVSHLHGVADTPELRTAYAEGLAKLIDNEMAVGQNRDLYEVLQALAADPALAALPDEDRVALDHAIRDFTLAGVALEPDARERFKAVSIELSAVSTDFGAAILDATDAWSEHVTDPALLRGVAPADLAMFADTAKARGLDGWLVTLQAPSVNAILTFAEDRDLRFRVYEAFGTRASDRGPNAGQFDNGARIARILALRHEAAALLGFSDPVAWSLATKMAPDAETILAFLRDLAKRARPAAERDLAELQTFAAETLGISNLEQWDIRFASNRLREARYTVDEQKVRAYFPVERVLSGWEKLLGRLFGITLILRNDVPLYHSDARYYDVADESGEIFSGLYTDLHARPGKRSGAWMGQARPRLDDGNAIRVPVAYLVCNFAPTGGESPSLLSHDDITTLLHETGHALHHLFTRVNRPSIAGTSGFEWDAVELPSQLMEDFAWDRDVLTSMSGQVETGAPLPTEMFDKLVQAKHFQSGLFLLRQIEFALFDLLLHLGTKGSDPMEVLEAVRDEVAVCRPPAWHRFPHSFGHIFSGGYAAGYYSYLWAEVLAADAFRRFVEAGVIDRPTGDRLREDILSKGATRPAAESFRAFRGRDPDPAAMLLRHGLAEVAAAE